MSESWYSDAALEKQRLLENVPRDLVKPRTQPTADERCRCCGSDARDGAGGDGSHCSICVGRGHGDDCK